MGFAYARSSMAPRLLNATIFLDSVRAALRAGEQLRSTLAPRLEEVLATEFPYLERRHMHVLRQPDARVLRRGSVRRVRPLLCEPALQHQLPDVERPAVQRPRRV